MLGKDNVDADYSSRHFDDNLEWKLNASIFSMLVDFWGEPEIDMFASRTNAQLKNYVAWHPDPEALYIDAYSFSWENLYFYAFSPFNQIFSVLQKITEDRCEALLIVRLWTTQVWFSQCLQITIDYPILLPKNVIRLPHQPMKVHPLQEKLRLVAMRLSGNLCAVKRFHDGLQTSYCVAGEKVLNYNIPHMLPGGDVFVVKGKLIVLKRM